MFIEHCYVLGLGAGDKAVQQTNIHALVLHFIRGEENEQNNNYVKYIVCWCC